MVPDIGLVEFLLVAVVALIVVGPRELPVLMRRVGGLVRRARVMANDFRHAFDEMGREADLDQLRREVRELQQMKPLEETRRELSDVDREAREALRGDTKA